MKKIYLILALFTCFGQIFAQGNMPVNQPIGSANSENYTLGLQGATYGYRFRTVYADTAALNLADGGIIKSIPNVLAVAGDTLYLRNKTATKWLNQGAAGGTTGVTSVSAGNGMNFTTITGAGSVILGTPGSTTLSSTNATTTNSHTHAFVPGGTSGQIILGNGTLGTLPTGTVTYVGLTVTTPSSPAFSTTNTPITTSGNIALNVLGNTGQYIRGDGSLATTPVLTNEWHLNGNTLTGSEYLGSNNDFDVIFKRNGTQSGLFRFNATLGVNEFSALSVSSLYASHQALTITSGISPTTNKTTFDPSSLSSARTLRIPDSSGTIALLQNITIPTWQQTLTAGSTLTGDNTIAGGGNVFTWDNVSEYYINTTAAMVLANTSGPTLNQLELSGNNILGSYNTATGRGSNITMYPDTLVLKPSLGNLTIDTLNNSSTQNTLIGWTTTSGSDRGKVGYITTGSGVSIVAGVLSATGSGGTVIQVNALTLGTTGTDLTSSVANSTTTPTITLNVPTASASNRGALSSTDWSTFNNKQATGLSLLLAGGTMTGKINLATGTTGLSPLQFTGGAPTTSLAAGNLMFNTGLLILDSTSSHRDTLATRNWTRNNFTNGGGGGGSSLFPTTGTGTATGDVTGLLSGYTLTMQGTADADNYLRLIDNATGYSLFDYSSHDVGADVFGYARLSINPEDGFNVSTRNEANSSSASIQVFNQGGGINLTKDANSISLGGSGTEFTGNVGIGTAPTSNALEVSGNFSINSGTNQIFSNSSIVELGDINANGFAGIELNTTGHTVTINANGGTAQIILDATGATVSTLTGSGTRTVTATSAGILGTTDVGVASTPRLTGQTAAASLTSYTVGASDASFIVSANILVTTATLHSFTCRVVYTDESNTSRTVTMNFSTLAGAITPTIANAGGAQPYEGVPLHIRAKAGTTITVSTAGTFTTVTYNLESALTKLN